MKKSRISSFHHDINLLSPSPNAPMSITRQPTGRFGPNLNPSLGYDPSSTRRSIGVASPPPPRSFRPGCHSNERFREGPLPPKLLTPTPPPLLFVVATASMAVVGGGDGGGTSSTSPLSERRCWRRRRRRQGGELVPNNQHAGQENRPDRCLAIVAFRLCE